MRSESWKVAPIFTDKGRARNLWKFKFSNVVVPFVGVNITLFHQVTLNTFTKLGMSKVVTVSKICQPKRQESHLYKSVVNL